MTSEGTIAAPSGSGAGKHGVRSFGSGGRDERRSSVTLFLVMSLVLVYCLLPLLWLIVNTTKNNSGLFDSFGLWFGHGFHLGANLREVFTYQGGIYRRWLENTVLYTVVGAGGAALIAALGGYGLAKYRFRGQKVVHIVVLSSVMVPPAALAVPTYLLFSRIHLVNTIWAVIVPSLASPFGFYLMRVYALDAVPDEVIDAARVDGAGELRIFRNIAWRLLVPGFVTVLLLQVVATWNNYFLPLIVLNDPRLFPLTVGLSQWNSQATAGGAGAQALYPLVITGSLIALLPLLVVFLFLQRYWRSGLATGSVK